MYKRGSWYKRLCFLLTLCLLITSVFSVAVINGHAASEGITASQPEASAVREIIQGTLSRNGKVETYSYNLIAENGKVIPLTGDTFRMNDYIGANISAAGYYDNVGIFCVETFVLQEEGNHVMVSNNLMYFNDATGQKDNIDNIKGSAVVAWDSRFVKYFRASVITESGSYEISLNDVLSTTDPEVRVGIFDIYSGGNLVKKCIKGTLYQLFPNPNGYFKFYSDGEVGKQWHVSGYFSSRYDGIASTYSPTPTKSHIIAIPTPTESFITATPTSTESTTTVSPTPAFVTPNPLVGKSVKIQLTSNNFDYVYYYFNKLPDTTKENKIGMTTRAYVENAEIFSIADAGDGKVFLKAISPEGNVDGFLSVDSDGRVVINTSLTPEKSEMFELNYQAYSGYFNLKSAHNSKFVCADVFSGYSVMADRNEASVWETFYANIVSDIIMTPPTITPQTPVITPLPVTTPPTVYRPQTPSVKRTPGPTELDVIYTISGTVKAGNGNINLDDCTTKILGTELSQKGSRFMFNTLYSCGKLRISKPGYLTREVQIEKFIYGSKDVLIFAGDINQDGAINMTDILEIAKCFNSEQGDKIFNKVCDLNGDTLINMSDIMLTAVHFNSIADDYEKLSDGLSTSEFKLEFDVEQAKEISKYSADIKGAIYKMSSGWCVTPVWVEFWEKSNPIEVTMTSSDMIFYYPDFIARTITGLKPGTTYEYRVNSSVGSSDIKSFTTLSDNTETRLSISCTYPYTHTVILSAKLEDIDGNPVVNKKISCYGMEAVTRDNGEALFNINVAAQEDYGYPYIDVIASFAGDDQYLKCEEEKRITLKNPRPYNMKYEEIKGFSINEDGEFVIQNNKEFSERFRYIWDHNPISERKITDAEFQNNIVLGFGKIVSCYDYDKLTLTLDKIIYSGGTYKVYYSYIYNPTGGSLSQGIYRMALVEKLPFTQVEFYENEKLVKTIAP